MKALIKGDIIASLYEIHEILSGGKGNIYICYHKDRKKFYALKTIKEEYFYSKDEFQAFQRETELWIGLGKHPNIVQALTLRDFGGRIFLVLEYTEFSSEDIRHFSQALYELNHFHEALNYCEKAIVMNRNDYEAWNIKGIILNALGKHDEALLSFQESVKINPDYYHAWINMGKSLREKNLLDEAIKSFEKALSFKISRQTLYNKIKKDEYLKSEFEDARVKV